MFFKKTYTGRLQQEVFFNVDRCSSRIIYDMAVILMFLTKERGEGNDV